MKKLLVIFFIMIFSIFLIACSGEDAKVDDSDQEASTSIMYSNKDYGFTFELPKSWKGYMIITEVWEGRSLEGSDSGEVIETGPKLLIRHPKWTTEKPMEDIPIMVFTMEQWDKVQQEKISLGAAPVGPSELGRNSTYVFALPARYNFDFLDGYEEVEQILTENPLKANTKSPEFKTKMYTYQNIEFELTNVVSERTETMTDDGGNEWTYTVITYYPGAKLSIIKADMSDATYSEDGKAHPQWGILIDSDTVERILITDDIKPVEITLDMKGIYNLEASLYIFRFEPYAE